MNVIPRDLKRIVAMMQMLSYVLTNKQKRQCLKQFILVCIGALLDTMSVAMVMPFAISIMNPKQLMDKPLLASVFAALRIDTEEGIILVTGATLALIIFLKNVFLGITSHDRISMRWNMQKELQIKMLDSYMTRPFTYYLGINTGDVLNGIINDVNSLYTVIEYIFTMMANIITLLMIVVYLCLTDLQIAVSMLFVTGICFIGVTLLFRKLLNGAGQRQRLANAESYKYAYQSINGIKEIHVMQRKGFFIKNYEKAIKKSTKESIRFYFLNSCPKLIIETICTCGIVLTLCVRYVFGYVDAMFISKVAAFIMATVRLLPLVASTSSVANGVIFYWAGLKNTYEIIKEAEQYSGEQNSIIEEDDENLEESSTLEIDSISWQYPGAEKKVLKDLSLTVHSKQSVALIGTSGAGKTTVSDIIMGLYKPQSGSIKFGGKDIFCMPKRWSKTVGYVPQSLFLIDDTIRTNITFGIDEEDIDESRVKEAIERAQLKSYIDELPNGLNTIVGERGIRLSGGQRQRIAIARALYNDPEILILDEATSALDNETERAVMEAIDSLQGLKTMIIIAHRLSTIKNCDAIYEIKGGKAVQKPIGKNPL